MKNSTALAVAVSELFKCVVLLFAE